MNSHKHAALTPLGRALLVRRVLHEGWKVVQAAQAAGVSEEHALEAMELEGVYYIGSTDARWELLDEEGDGCRDRIGSPDPALEAAEARQWLAAGLRRLDRRLRTVIHHRFFEELSQAEVGRRLGLSQMHVSRLERQALQQLRRFLE